MNRIYPKYKNALMLAKANTTLLDNTVRVALVDNAIYAYDSSHEFKESLVGAIVSESEPVLNKTITGSTFSGDQTVFPNVVGDTVEAAVVFIEGDSAGSSRLVAYYDSSSGLPLTPNGGDLSINWNNGIFKL